MIIYKATNLVNGKIYIGQTVRQFEVRKNRHINDAFKCNSTTAFHRALRKYGNANFNWEVIDISETEEELNQKEVYWISFYNSYALVENSNGYNMTIGGDGVSGYKQTDEHMQKCRDSFKRNGKTKGSNNHNTKFTDDDVLMIKELIKTGMSLAKIARKYDVKRATIGQIKRGETWSHVGEDVSNIEYIYKTSKLTENEVREIKLLLKEGKLTQKEIANIYGVKGNSISNIKNGKSWMHVDIA